MVDGFGETKMRGEQVVEDAAAVEQSPTGQGQRAGQDEVDVVVGEARGVVGETDLGVEVVSDLQKGKIANI